MIKSTLSLTLKVVVVFLVLVGLSRLTGALPFSLSVRQVNKDNSLYVSGEGSYFATPDTATTSLGVTLQASTAKEVQRMANEKINAITEALKKLGVEEKNIKTTNYSIYPTYNTDRITGYSANINISVKEKDFDRMNQVLDTASAAGANVVSGVNFEIEDRDMAVAEARKEAVEKAKTKAEQIAKDTGIRLGKIINVSEYYPYAYDARGFGGAKEAMSSELAVPQANVEPGQTEIVVNVTLTYEIL